MPKYGPARPGRIPTWVRPPKAAQRIAAKALEAREELPPSKRGGLTKAQAGRITSGVERAKSIARGDWQPAEDIRDFFNRFKGTYQDALLKGKSWRDSKVQQAWDLWGGNPMWEAAKKALAKAQKPEKGSKGVSSIMRKALR